ncbi:MAG: hypothetical protein LBO62_03780, partial [Endomicrobium sp.]|nr:hypothetical protein [Endomicrobium sp.]
INKDMQGVVKTAASVSAKIQQIVSSILEIINNKIQETNANQQKLSEQEIKTQEAKFAHKRSMFYRYNEEQKKEAIIAEKDLIDMQLSSYKEGTEKHYQLSKQKEEKDKELRDLGNFDMVSGFTNAIDEIANKSINFKDFTVGIFGDFQKALSDTFVATINNMDTDWQSFSDSVTKIAQGLKDTVIKAFADMAAKWVVQQAALLLKEKVFATERITTNAAVGASGAAAASSWSLWGALAIGAAIGAAIMAFAGNFTYGGIVGGTSWNGDNMIARVNSGEMILNNTQQANLWNLANGAGLASGGAGITINQNIEINNANGDLSSLTQAIRRGTLDALEFAGVTYNVGAKQSGVAL